jgi:hypothetical protein
MCTGLFRGLGRVSPAARRWGKRLRGDLDNIVSHGPSQGSPQRRYASVEQFAEDIRRHLGNLPVVARKAVSVLAFPLREL